MQNSPQMTGFGMAVTPIPARKRTTAASRYKIIPIVMRRSLARRMVCVHGLDGLKPVRLASSQRRQFKASSRDRRRGTFHGAAG
jgi:hypothetical protein